MSKIKMQVDAPQSPADPADPNFVDSLPDPLRSYAQEALAVDEGEGDETAGDANARLDKLEIATRSHLLELAEPLLAPTDKGGAGAPLATLLRYLKDVTLLCLHVVQSHGKMGAPAVKKLPFLLLEDAVDALPVGHVQSLWSSPNYPTLNVHGYTTTLLCSKHIFGPPSKLILLRICNKLLKVLSNRDVDAEFAGSLMLMTAKVFPLSERSAVNVLGSFNVANETIFEGEEEFDEKGALSAGEKKGGDGKIIGGSNIGYDFYKTFWGVQKVFTDPQGTVLPSRLGLSPAAAAAAYSGFVRDVASILAALESTPAPKAAASTLSKLDDAPLTAGGDAVRHHKYLTSSQLLHLQLKDAKLRIHFLSQLIIILSYLSSPSVVLPAPPVAATAGADAAKLSAQIRSAQATQLADVEKRAWQLLRATSPPMGESMHRSLRWLLRERESMWRGWKRGKCLPAQDKVGAVGVGGRDVRKKLSGRKRKAEDGLDPTDGPISKQDLAKSTVPALSDFLEPYVEALDPENGIEGEYHPRNDTVYSWRALRLLAQDQSETASGVGGHLSRFDKLRRCDGDFEGLVRGIWEENGEEIGGELPEDYYEDPGEEVAKAKEAPDADMLDDVSVGSPVADEGATEEDEAAKKEKMAEFAKAAMDMDVELLDEDAGESKGDSKEEDGAEEEESKVKIEDKAEADEKDIRDAAAETVMSMFDDEPKKKEAKKEPAAKGKAAAAKDEPTKAPRGKAKRGAKAQNGKKEQADSHWQEKRECPPSPGRTKFTPPPPKDQPHKGEDRSKNEPRDNSRGRYNHRRNNSDGHHPSDRRGDRSQERGRDGSTDGRRGRFQPPQNPRDARGGRDNKSRSPPTVPGGGRGGGRGRGSWEPPGGRGGGRGRGGRGGGRGNYRGRGRGN